MSDKLKKDSFWVGGKFTVQEIIKKSRRKILQIAIHEKNKKSLNEFQNKKIPIKIVNDKFFNKLFNKDLDIHQGWAIEILPISPLDLNTKLKSLNSKSLFLILDGINDARNIGSIIRSSAALGCDAIIIDNKNYNPKSNMMFRAASGMTEVVDIISVTNINNTIQVLKKNNFWIYGMDANASTDIRSINFEPRIAFVFGSETNGIKHLVQKNCDKIIKIKIKDKAESLNISNAVAIALALANK
jgi:23S rRNA (guanosine2251-2'-O)-methyltransferase